MPYVLLFITVILAAMLIIVALQYADARKEINEVKYEHRKQISEISSEASKLEDQLDDYHEYVTCTLCRVGLQKEIDYAIFLADTITGHCEETDSYTIQLEVVETLPEANMIICDDCLYVIGSEYVKKRPDYACRICEEAGTD